ncbi:MAG TPA: type II toxin-antitoxin system antitoxin SocA domain-containing protein [Fimbriimonadaceae bacterium]|jgi:hypothetical protein
MAIISLDQLIMPTGRPVFNAAKVNDAIALLAPSGHSYDLGKLLVMLYLVDRKLVQYAGSTLTEDQYYSVEGVGPAPRGVATVFLTGKGAARFKVPFHLTSRTRIKVLSNETSEALSEPERAIIAEVRELYGNFDSATFRQKVTEEAPEWKDFIGHEFTFKELLIALGENAADAEAAFTEWEGLRHLKHQRGEAA